jgi:thiamine biosynthesis protein ThiI
MAALDLPMALQRHELVTFRRLMVRVGERLAEQYGYDGLVLGDSLGQVASQTMENISAVDRAVEIPVFRPLIGMDKVEIVNLVSSIGLEEVAAASYKDCCSIIARHPSTRANLEKIRDVEQWIDAGRVVEAITSSVEIVPAYEGRSEDARERASRRLIVDMP